jgi:hypothetical protein
MNKVYKLIIALSEVNGLVDVEYHSNKQSVIDRQSFFESKGLKTLISEENARQIEVKQIKISEKQYVTIN